MALGDNIICQTQTQSRALPGRFGGEEGLEDFVADGFGDARAVVLYPNLHCIIQSLCPE